MVPVNLGGCADVLEGERLRQGRSSVPNLARELYEVGRALMALSLFAALVH